MSIPYVDLFLADPVLALRNALRFGHFISFAIGLGGATMLDLILLRFFVLKRITSDQIDIFNFSSKIINYSLIVIWITGIGFLIHYYNFDPKKLGNPKLYAKFSIIVLLTLNGVFIHHKILPILNKQIGNSLFEKISKNQRLVFIASAAISVTSWYTPVALGAFSQLNFKVDAVTLLLTYLLLVVGVFAAMNLLLSYLLRASLPAAESAIEAKSTTKSVGKLRPKALAHAVSNSLPALFVAGKNISAARKAASKAAKERNADASATPTGGRFPVLLRSAKSLRKTTGTAAAAIGKSRAFSPFKKMFSSLFELFHTVGPDGARDYAHLMAAPAFARVNTRMTQEYADEFGGSIMQQAGVGQNALRKGGSVIL